VNPIKNVSKASVSSPVLVGALTACIWLAAGALLLSLILKFSSMQENSLPMSAMAVHGCASLAGGFSSGKRSGRKGWYFGGALGILYALIIILVGFLSVNAGFSSHTWKLLAVVIPAGALGGIIGVNLKK
jgi:putative membrane protein (TIGR04086 family)